MILIPASVALALLWRNGHLVWLCWVVAALTVFTWMASRTMLLTKSEYQRGLEANRAVSSFWELMASLALWVHWLVCIAAIVAALVSK